MNSIVIDYIERTAKSADVKKCCLWSAFFTVLLMALAVFKGILAEYIVMMLPALIVNIIVICYGCSQGARKICINGIATLNLCAAMTQAIFGIGDGKAISTCVLMLVGIACVMLVGYVLRKSRVSTGIFRKESTWIILSALAMIGTLVLCLFMPPINGARAWLVIGGKPILQLTEVAKLAYVFFIGMLFSVRSRRGKEKAVDWVKLIFSGVVTAVAAALLYKINEFGTLLIIGSVFFAVSMICLKNNKCKLLVLLCVVILIAVVCFAYMAAENRIGKWECPECTTVNHKTAECGECEAKKQVGDYNFKCPVCLYTTWGENEMKSVQDDCEMCKRDGFLSTEWGKACKKIYDRGSVTFNFDVVKGTDNAYHMEQNQKSIKVGRLFGDMDSVVYVPAADTDSVLASLMNRLGLIFAVVILMAFFAVFFSIYHAASPMRIMAICTFTFQAFYTFCGTLNILPMTGVGLPLISRGGTNLVISYVLIYIMITATRDKREVSK